MPEEYAPKARLYYPVETWQSQGPLQPTSDPMQTEAYMSSTTQMANFSRDKLSFFVALAGLELMAVFMFQSPGCWDYRAFTAEI